MTAGALARPTYRQPGLFRPGLFQALIAFAVIGLAVSHAIARHGARDADLVRQCLDRNGPSQIWQSGGRYVLACKMGEDKYGLRVVDRVGEALEEKTGYIKGRWRDVLNSMKNKPQFETIWEAGSGEPLPPIFQ